jgi:hypothetical protein
MSRSSNARPVLKELAGAEGAKIQLWRADGVTSITPAATYAVNWLMPEINATGITSNGTQLVIGIRRFHEHRKGKNPSC